MEDCSTGLNICFTRRAHIGEITNKGWTALGILYESSHPGLALEWLCCVCRENDSPSMIAFVSKYCDLEGEVLVESHTEESIAISMQHR